MNTPQQLFKFLDQLKIEYQTYSHKAVFTVDEAENLLQELPPYGHCKNLFLKDRKKRYWLVVALFDTKISLKKLAKELDAPELRFANPDELKEYLGVTPGAVTLFGIVHDKEHKVHVVIDKRLYDHTYVGFHPLHNEATTYIEPNDIMKFVKACGNTIIVMPFYEMVK